jgi:hypothetical protein
MPFNTSKQPINNNRRPTASLEVASIISSVARTNGVVPRAMSDEEIQAGMFFPLINEGEPSLFRACRARVVRVMRVIRENM